MEAQGVFSLVCPDCGEPLEQRGAQVVCTACHREFLARVGHLIPLGITPPTALSSATGGERT